MAPPNERVPMLAGLTEAADGENVSDSGRHQPRVSKARVIALGLTALAGVALLGLAMAVARQHFRTAAAGKSLFLQEVPPPPPPAAPAPQAAAAAPAAPAAPAAGGLTVPSAGGRCVAIKGVKVAEAEGAQEAFPKCSAPWTEDCSQTGCCIDGTMKCYEKQPGVWSACKATCTAMDEKNETWTCKEVAPPVGRTADACFENCATSAGCAQAIFNADGGGSCSQTLTGLTKIAWVSDNFESAFCSDGAQALADQVAKQLPWEMPLEEPKKCSWGGEDCAETKCCNDVSCDKDFTACYSYSCYRKTQYFSGCSINAPPADWEGTWLGGGREHLTVPSASSQVQVQGTSLYCIMVVAWNAPSPKPFWAPEADLANNIKNNGIGIFQCDAHDIIDGVETPKAEWGSFSNIDAFQQMWKVVKSKGEYKKHDWTVKVDADAIFFPNRLKQHLDKLRTPKNARVYLENINFRFKFMGALEVVTTQALDLFLERGDECIRGEHAGGEDFFMKGCMDALGIGHQTDFDLLKDRYAGMDAPCTDGWAVAYHYRKKVISWNWCYNEAVCGGPAKSCDAGLPVEYLP